MIDGKIDIALKRKFRHFDSIFITGCTRSCHFDNFLCSQWRKFRQNDSIPFQYLTIIGFQQIPTLAYIFPRLLEFHAMRTLQT